MCCPGHQLPTAGLLSRQCIPTHHSLAGCALRAKSRDLSLRLPICNIGIVTTPPQSILRVK